MRLMDYPLEPYRINGIESALTPALAVYPEHVDANIAATLRLMNGDANRWRPHLKTSKLGFIMRRLVEHGVVNVKCSTTLELLSACEAGARDVLVAYAMVGANARRVREIADQYGDIRVSILVENEAQAASWHDSNIGIQIDVNSGMNRTGIDQARVDQILSLARAAGGQFRGLHYYDGHISAQDMGERERAAHAGYDRLMEVIAALDRAGVAVPEVITSGTPAFPCGLSYAPFSNAAFTHRVSPGTIVYNDFTSLAQLPAEYGYRPAALILATVVSHPLPNVVTCDAGHKSVSADAGVPTCQVLGRPDLMPLKPSEEHLPLENPAGSAAPAIGETLYLLPRHICPSVNNFDDALIVEGGRITRLERVTARGHESPMVSASAHGR
jgi:D-serine deaminase-like pyridoxal phosphate-dependent protein